MQPNASKWDAKCLAAFLRHKPFEEGMNAEIHRQVFLLAASSAFSAGISAGHAGKLAARLYDSIQPFIAKSARYDEMIASPGIAGPLSRLRELRRKHPELSADECAALIWGQA